MARSTVLVLTLVLGVLTQAGEVAAQAGNKVYRVGWVALGSASPQLNPSWQAFKARLAAPATSRTERHIRAAVGR